MADAFELAAARLRGPSSTSNEQAVAMAGGDATARHTASEIQDKFKVVRETLPNDSDIKNIQCSTKMMVLLNEIGCQSDITKVLESSFTDYWIPIPSVCLRECLDPDAVQRFEEFQPRFLDDALEMTGRHFNLSDDALEKKGEDRYPKTLKYEETLGSGGFADVVRVRSIQGQQYALKTIGRKTLRSEAKKQMKYIKEEVEVLRKVNHIHCIKFVSSYTDTLIVGMVMDPVADCNLELFLDDFRVSGIQPQTLGTFFGCLTTALTYLHYELKIRHKDIKPKNILVKEDRVMIADFGISLDWSEVGHATTREEARRSPIYCAPEAADDLPRNLMTDIWPLGCVFLEMVAVLKGRGRAFVEDTLSQNGSSSKYFRNNLDGTREAIRLLSSEGPPCYNKPLEWVEVMLRVEKDDRPNSKQLRRMVLEPQGLTDISFCGSCCNTGWDGDDSDAFKKWPTANPGSVIAQPTELQKPESAQILNTLMGTWDSVKMARYQQSTKSWISSKCIQRCGLISRISRRMEEIVYGGIRFESGTYVAITWYAVGSTYTRLTEFWIAPETVPFEMLVGSDEILDYLGF